MTAMVDSDAPGTGATLIVDGHAHVWSFDTVMYPWQPTFHYVPTEAASPDELLAAMDRHGVQHAMLVQPSVYGSDHRFLLETVRANPDRFLAIGLVDPAQTGAGAAAGRLIDECDCVGLRVNLSLDPSRAADQARSTCWNDLEAIGAPVCLRATPAHHALVLGILARHRRLRVVVDHLGLPQPGHTAETIARLGELARFEQCRIKIAGLARLADSSSAPDEVWPLIQAALELFGPSRLLWGSDFPAVDRDGGYLAAIRAIEAMPFVGPADRDQLMARTALELWGEPSERSRR